MSSSLSSRPARAPVTTREIWNLTWPQALMMLFQFLVGFTDVVVAGHIHPHVQAAFGIIMQCHFTLLVIGFAVSNGGLSAMSQSLGAGLPLRAKRYAGLITMIAMAVCLLIVLLGYVFRNGIFTLLGVPAELRQLTDSLWIIMLSVIPAHYLVIQTSAIFRANKNVIMPLWSGIMVCAVNIVGDLGLGLGYFGMPNMGAEGLVLATLLSVTAGAIFNMTVIWKKRYMTMESFAPWRWQAKAAPYLVKVALPSAATQALWQMGHLALLFITARLPIGNVTALAGLAAGIRMESFLFLPAIAFSATGSVLVGHCLGAGDKAEAKKVGLKVAAAAALIMSLVAGLFYPFLPAVAAFVTPDPAVQVQAISYMHYNLLAVPFTVTSMVMTGILTGAGASVYPMVVNSVCIWMIRLPVAWYLGLELWHSAAGIFCAMLISQCIQASSHYYAFLRLDWARFALTSKRIQRT